VYECDNVTHSSVDKRNERTFHVTVNLVLVCVRKDMTVLFHKLFGKWTLDDDIRSVFNSIPED